MKWIFLVISCFMLYLSCLPCMDGLECAAPETSAVSSTDNHREHEHASESCSPFCTCSCCSITVFHVPFTKPVATKALLRSAKHPLRNIVFHTEVYDAIWQPPQLV